jgi:hypothetical protein
MRYFIFFLGLIIFNTKLYALGFCSAYEDSNGTLDFTSLLPDMSNLGDCEVAPDVYQIVLYDVGFCTSAPTAPSSSSGFDPSSENCTSLFANSSGVPLDLAVGVSLNMSPDINIANGTYTHGYVIMKNSFGIKATKTFTDANLINTTNDASVEIFVGLHQIQPKVHHIIQLTMMIQHLQLLIVLWNAEQPLVQLRS